MSSIRDLEKVLLVVQALHQVGQLFYELVKREIISPLWLCQQYSFFTYSKSLTFWTDCTFSSLPTWEFFFLQAGSGGFWGIYKIFGWSAQMESPPCRSWSNRLHGTRIPWTLWFQRLLDMFCVTPHRLSSGRPFWRDSPFFLWYNEQMREAWQKSKVDATPCQKYNRAH